MTGILDASLTASTLRSAVDSLREGIRLRQVVPIIGPDALTVTVVDANGHQRTELFHRLVAERLLRDYKLDPQLLDTHSLSWDLHRATQAVMAHTGQTAARLRRSVGTALGEVIRQAKPAGALRALAELTCFDLIVTLTPDECLNLAFSQVQPQTTLEVRGYMPRAATSQLESDLGASLPGNLGLFHLLGRSESATDFAIHEEDALEYLYRLHDEGERRHKLLLTRLRHSDLLFIGCSLPDWMGRGLMRLLNFDRLAATERSMEFFCAAARDARFGQFLGRFSSQTTVFPWSPQELVTEIAAWNRGLPQSPAAAGPRRHQSTGAAGAPSIFVSYASENTDAARRLAEQLMELGFGDVWLDRKRLVAGDDWSASIQEAIAQCDFFLPVLSKQADQRREGVFWDEWQQALARAMRVVDSFVIPVGVDGAPPRKLGYQRIFNGFTRPFAELHLIHAPAGQLDPDGQRQLRQVLRRFAEAQTQAQGQG